MSQQYSCPFCPSESRYSAGTANSVRSHITRKTDPAHKGKNGYDLEEGELVGDADPPTAEDPPSDGSADGDGLNIPDAGGTSDGSSDATEMVQTPCGCEQFDASELDVPEEGLLLACDTCGKEFGVYP